MLALTILSLLWPRAGSAQVALTWRRHEGAEACPDAAALRAQVATRVGSDWLQDERATRLLEGEVTPLHPGHRVRILLREQDGLLLGERTLSDGAPDCAALTEATLLAIALLFESLPPPPAAPAAAPSARPAPESIAPATVGPKRGAAAPTTAAWRYSAIAGALASVALLPSPAAHGFIGLQLAPSRLYAIELRLVALGAAREQLGGDSLGSARFSPAYALLVGCREVARTRRLAVGACLGLMAGVLRVRGSGFSERDYAVDSPLLAGSVRSSAELRLLGPLYTSLSLGLGVPLLHARFVALDTNGRQRELARTRPLFATLELGLGARF